MKLSTNSLSRIGWKPDKLSPLWFMTEFGTEFFSMTAFLIPNSRYLTFKTNFLFMTNATRGTLIVKQNS